MGSEEEENSKIANEPCESQIKRNPVFNNYHTISHLGFSQCILVLNKWGLLQTNSHKRKKSLNFLDIDQKALRLS